tara:strand:+ start:319 stop:666 length:348 start_codon:yes stop_codon:yes gene_type:complete
MLANCQLNLVPPGTTVLGVPSNERNAKFCISSTPERSIASVYEICSDEELMLSPSQLSAVENNINAKEYCVLVFPLFIFAVLLISMLYSTSMLTEVVKDRDYWKWERALNAVNAH